MEAIHPNYIIVPSCADMANNQGWDLSIPTNAKLLIHSNTTDGSTTFVDTIGTHTPAVGAADVEHDTAQQRFGTTSILFDGDSGYLTVPDHADWFMSTGKFAITFWVRFATVTANQGIFQQYADDNNRVYCYWMYVFGGGSTLYFYIHPNNATPSVTLSATWEPSANQWYHVAIIRGWAGGANNWALVIDGQQIGSTVSDSDTWPDLGAALEIGLANKGTPGVATYFNGWMDEILVVKGSTPWTTNFIPPYGYYR